jgi:hypothetical protein
LQERSKRLIDQGIDLFSHQNEGEIDSSHHSINNVLPPFKNYQENEVRTDSMDFNIGATKYLDESTSLK